ncbi:MAG: M56 family metallopeptidase [Gemmataceae bacterium]
MDGLIQIGLSNAIVAGLLGLVALGVGRVCRRPGLVRLLWLLVLVKLLTPPLVPLPVPSSALPFASLDADHTEAISATWEAWSPWVGGLWLGGAGFFLLVTAVRAVCSRRRLGAAQPAPSELQTEADALARSLRMKQPPVVYTVADASGLASFSLLGQAHLYFPEALVDRLDPSERMTLLARELAGLALRCPWSQGLALGVRALFWWYPLTWLVPGWLAAAEEELRDAQVLKWLPGFNAEYAGALVEMSDLLDERGGNVGARPPGPHPHLERRLTMIVQGKPTTGWSLGASLAALPLLALVLFTPLWGQATPPDAPGEQAEETTPAPIPVAEVKAEVPPLPPPLPEEPDRYGGSPRKLLGTLAGQIWAVALSPDGKSLAVVSGDADPNQDGALTLFDLPAGTERASLSEARGIRCVAFSRDGKRLVTGDFANRIQVRDPQTGAVRQTLEGHTAGVNAVALSPDGKRLLSASLDRTARLWDLDTGKTLLTLPGHTDWVLGAALSSDGKLALTVSKDGTGRVWDLPSGKLRHVLKGHGTWIEGCAIAPDGKVVATFGHDNLTKLWDPASGKHLRDLSGHAGIVNRGLFLADGRQLATCSHDRTVRFWDIETGALLSTLETRHEERIYGLDLAADGKSFVTGSWDRSARVWQRDGQEPELTLVPRRYRPESNFPILTVAVSPDGRTLAVGGEERLVKLVDVATGSVRQVLEGHEDFVTHVAFAPDGKRLATASFDGTIKLWEVGTGKLLHTLTGHENWVFSVVFSPDGLLLASGGYDRTVRLWEVATGKALATLDKHRAGVRAVAFSRDGKLLASGGTDRAVRVWDVAKREVVHTLKGHDNAVRDLVFSPQADLLASAGEDNTIRLWDLHEGKSIATNRANAVVRALAYSPAGRHLVSVDEGNNVRLLDGANLAVTWTSNAAFNQPPTSVAFGPRAETLIVGSLDQTVAIWQGQVSPRGALATLHSGDQEMNAVAYSPDGRWLALAGHDRALRVRDARFGQRRASLEETPTAAFGMALSPNGKLLAVACYDNCVRLYDAGTRKLVARLDGYKERVWTVAFSPDGNRLATASGSYGNADQPGEVRIWDVPGRKPLFDIPDVEASAMAVAWSRDGKWLAVGTRDGRARLHDAATGKLRHDLKGHTETVRFACFSPDSRYLATAGMNDRTIRIWSVETGAALDRLEGHSNGVNCVAWSADGKLLAAASAPGKNEKDPPGVWLWQVGQEKGKLTFQPPRRLQGHRNNCLACALSPDGKLVVSVGGVYAEEGEAFVWETATGKQLARLQGHRRWCEGVLFSLDGQTLFTSGGTHESAGEVHLWNVGDRGGWSVEAAHAGPITAAVWSPDGKRLATGSEDQTLKVWDGATGKLLHTFERAHQRRRIALAFRPDGKVLAAASDDGAVRLWDLEGKAQLTELARHTLKMPSLAFAPDGKRLAVASGQTREREGLHLVEVDTGKEPADAAWAGQPTSCVVFSPDGKWLAAGSPSGALRIYEAATGKLFRQVEAARATRLAAFSSDGQVLATVDDSNSVVLWNTTTWTERRRFKGHARAIQALSFAADGRHLATGGAEGTVLLWALDAAMPTGAAPVARTAP